MFEKHLSFFEFAIIIWEELGIKFFPGGSCLIDTGKIGVLLGIREETSIREFIRNLIVDFPVSEEMSAASRYIENTVYDKIEDIQKNPDRKLIAWTNMETSS